MSGAEGSVPDLVVLCEYFYPDLGATGQLLTELVEDLTRGGRRIEVWTGHPSYADAKKVDPVTEYRGSVIRRVWSPQFDKNRLKGWFLNNLCFMLSMAGKTRRFARSRRLLICTCPPLLPVIGAIAKWFGDIKVTLLLHDIFPEIAVALGYIPSGGVLSRVLSRVMLWALLRADNIIVLGRDMQRIIAAKLPEEMKGKVEIIENWADGELIRPVPKSASWLAKSEGLEQKFVVQYSGNIGRSHDLEMVIHAAKRLEKDDVVFLFIGDGAKRKSLEELAQSVSASNVRFLPYRAKSSLGDSLACTDVSLVTLAPGVEGLAVPSKLYGILASGRPVLAVVPSESEIALTVEEGKCGIVVRPGDLSGMVEAVRYLRNDPELRERCARNARRIFEERYERKVIVSKFERLLFAGQGIGQG